eukprot:g76052.t1
MGITESISCGIMSHCRSSLRCTGKMHRGKRDDGISECAGKGMILRELWEKEPWFKHGFRLCHGRIKEVSGMSVISG